MDNESGKFPDGEKEYPKIMKRKMGEAILEDVSPVFIGKRMRKSSKKKYVDSVLQLVEVKPLTDNQEKVFEDWDDDCNLVLTGYAGTGKTFLSLYMAFSALEDRRTPYERVVIIRSAVPSRDMGFLPGDEHEKSTVYEDPYETIINKLHGRDDAYEIFKKKKILDFRTTSYMRGITYQNAIIIIDEIQNMTDSELNTIFTRFGDNTRFMACGDFRQTDLNTKKEKSGFGVIINILKRIKNVRMTDFGIDDIVRSGFVRDYIIQREKYFNDHQ